MAPSPSTRIRGLGFGRYVRSAVVLRRTPLVEELISTALTIDHTGELAKIFVANPVIIFVIDRPEILEVEHDETSSWFVFRALDFYLQSV